MKKMTRTEKIAYIEDAKDKIEGALENDHGYSNQVITFTLRGIAEKFGQHVADELIDEYGLEELGWHKQSGHGRRASNPS
jgi:hypothetical protein